MGGRGVFRGAGPSGGTERLGPDESESTGSSETFMQGGDIEHSNFPLSSSIACSSTENPLSRVRMNVAYPALQGHFAGRNYQGINDALPQPLIAPQSVSLVRPIALTLFLWHLSPG